MGLFNEDIKLREKTSYNSYIDETLEVEEEKIEEENETIIDEKTQEEPKAKVVNMDYIYRYSYIYNIEKNTLTYDVESFRVQKDRYNSKAFVNGEIGTVSLNNIGMVSYNSVFKDIEIVYKLYLFEENDELANNLVLSVINTQINKTKELLSSLSYLSERIGNYKKDKNIESFQYGNIRKVKFLVPERNIEKQRKRIIQKRTMTDEEIVLTIISNFSNDYPATTFGKDNVSFKDIERDKESIKIIVDVYKSYQPTMEDPIDIVYTIITDIFGAEN